MSQATVRIPTPLRSLTGGAHEVSVEGKTVKEALEDLGSQHDGILAKVLDDGGGVRPFVNVFVGSDNVKKLGGLEAELPPGAVLSIIPAVAGGRA